MDSVTPDEPRRTPIRWSVATVRDDRSRTATEGSPKARTDPCQLLVLEQAAIAIPGAAADEVAAAMLTL